MAWRITTPGRQWTTTDPEEAKAWRSEARILKGCIKVKLID